MRYSVIKISSSVKSVFLFSVFILSVNLCQAQNENPVKSKQSFMELNLGVAIIEIIDEHDRISFMTPYLGGSFLWGETIIYENNAIFEYQVGLAFPSIATAKIGIGKQINDNRFVFGVRPFPFTLYSQMSLLNFEKSSWIFSLEFNPLNSTYGISIASKGNFNIGYRWNLNRKKSIYRKHR